MRNLVILLSVLLIPSSSIANSDISFIDRISNFVTMKPKEQTITTKDKKQIECLAQNIYWEAGLEPYKGQLAVAMVTLKRVSSAHFPKTVCGVVKQKHKQTCQFSWWCEDRKREKTVNNKFNPKERMLLEDVRGVATYAFLNYKNIHDETKGALFYHNTSVNPDWKLKKTIKIGNHIFYRKS
jgi:spore germination cell wall hydrolase CwlJ-like protein